MSNKAPEATAKEVGKFGIVGVINTAVDLGIFNLLKFLFGLSVIISNVVSVSAAIVNSYIWNKNWTFRDKEKNISRQFIFFVILSIGGLIINTGALLFLTQVWTFPSLLVIRVFHFLKLSFIFSDNFVFFNFAKVAAILFSMIWNFLTYKKFVFKKNGGA